MGAHKPQLSGVVVTCNDARHLRKCLASLRFCDELIVVDLGLDDDSRAIAAELGATIKRHEQAPIVERIREAAVAHAAHDWVVVADPDEVYPAGLGGRLRSLIADQPQLGAIALPIQYYFRNQPLRCTFWGAIRSKVGVIHKSRVVLTANVHRGIELQDGYHQGNLPQRSAADQIEHYWADSYPQLVEKHWRYSQHEGRAQHDSGQRFAWARMGADVIKQLKDDLVLFEGLRGGPTGISLSVFRAWYRLMSWLSLRRHERDHSP